MLPQLATEFSTSVSAASVIVTAFAIAYAGAVLLQGPLGDRYGKLRVVAIGVALAGVAALGMAYIGDVVSLEDRQATIARFIAGSIFGQTLGPLFGGCLFLAGAAIMVVRTRRNWPAITPGRFEPLAIHKRLLARGAVRWLLVIGVAETFFFFGAYVFVGAFLRERFELSYTAIGLVLAGYGIGGLLYSSLVRWFLPLGERGLVVGGGLLGLAFFSAILFTPDWRYAVPATMGLGLAFYFVHSTIQVKASEVAPDARGSAIALYASSWAVGQATGVAALGAGVAHFWLRSNLWRLQP